MMLLSLLETILVTYLMEIDSASQEKLRISDDWEESKQEKEKVKNSNTGEFKHVGLYLTDSTLH